MSVAPESGGPPRHLVFGVGDTGLVVVRGLLDAGREVTAVDRDEAALARLARHHPAARGVRADALDPETFEAAGLTGAAGVALILPEDKDNLFLALAARQSAPGARIVCRSREPQKNRRKMLSAGADAVISPNFIGGLRMASEAVRPHATAFLDLLLHRHDHDIGFEEVEVPGGSPVAGSPIHSAGLAGCLVVALRARGFTTFEYNPLSGTLVGAGDALVLFGRADALAAARARIAGK